MIHTAHPAEHISHAVDKQTFLQQLRQHLKSENILSEPEDLRPYECDALSVYQVLPWVVTLPENTAQAQAILKLCSQYGVPVVARGGGTGLAGGALPIVNGVLLSLAKFNQILHIDPDNRCATVQIRCA